MTVTKRQIEIIEYIMNNVSGITGDKLAKYFGVSSRTIRNDILQINSALSGDQLLCQTEGRRISPLHKSLEKNRLLYHAGGYGRFSGCFKRRQ